MWRTYLKHRGWLILASVAAGLLVTWLLNLPYITHPSVVVVGGLADFARPQLLPAFLAALVAVLVNDLLVVRYGRPADRETRCRRCKYILRGLRDPRCPECGEPV